MLAVALDPGGRRPLGDQLYEQIRDLVLEGRLKPGERLPSTRALAAELGVSRTTTVSAYAQLESEGYLESRTGAGTFVSPELGAAILRGVSTELGANRPHGQSTTPARPDGAPFDPRMPDTRRFPFARWSRALARWWRAPGADVMRGDDPAGHPALRAEIAAHLRCLRGLACTAEQVIVTSGVVESLGLIVRALLSGGATVAVEEPGFPPAARTLAAAGTRIMPIPVDREGLMFDAVAPENASVRAVVVAPSRHYPLGHTLSVSRRLALIAWAEATGGLLIEDDYDSEYRFRGRPLAALMSLDRTGHVIYLGSFSKVMFRSLRLAYMVLPPRLIEPVRATLAAEGPAASWVPQPALAEFMASGEFAMHIRRMRRLYAGRQRALLAALDGPLRDFLHAPEQDAGMHVTALFRDGLAARTTDREASARAAEAGIVAAPLSACYRQEPKAHGFVLGFAGFDEQEIATGAAALSEVLAGCLGKGRPAATRRR